MSAVDRLRKITAIKEPSTRTVIVIEDYKIKRSLRVERLSGLTGHIAVQPSRKYFEGYETVVKNLADAFFQTANCRSSR